MYTIIYWQGNDSVYPVTNPNGTIMLFDKIDEADKHADMLEDSDDEIEARVISIDGAHV